MSVATFLLLHDWVGRGRKRIVTSTIIRTLLRRFIHDLLQVNATSGPTSFDYARRIKRAITTRRRPIALLRARTRRVDLCHFLSARNLRRGVALQVCGNFLIHSFSLFLWVYCRYVIVHRLLRLIIARRVRSTITCVTTMTITIPERVGHYRHHSRTKVTFITRHRFVGIHVNLIGNLRRGLASVLFLLLVTRTIYHDLGNFGDEPTNGFAYHVTSRTINGNGGEELTCRRHVFVVLSSRTRVNSTSCLRCFYSYSLTGLTHD